MFSGFARVGAGLPQRHRPQSGTTVIIQRDQLIDTRRRFPAEDLVSFAGADKCFVREPVKSPHAGFGCRWYQRHVQIDPPAIRSSRTIPPAVIRGCARLKRTVRAVASRSQCGGIQESWPKAARATFFTKRSNKTKGRASRRKNVDMN